MGWTRSPAPERIVPWRSPHPIRLRLVPPRHVHTNLWYRDRAPGAVGLAKQLPPTNEGTELSTICMPTRTAQHRGEETTLLPYHHTTAPQSEPRTSVRLLRVQTAQPQRHVSGFLTLYHFVSSERFLTCPAQNILLPVSKPGYKMKASVCCPTELSIFIGKRKLPGLQV